MVELEVEKVEGNGTPLVFIHGWLGSKESWSTVRSKLDIDNPLVFYSQRCHGESSCESFKMDDLAKDLETVTENLNEPILIGHSLGGMTALKYSTISDNYSSLLLFGTCASTPKPKYKSVKYFLDNLGKIPRKKWAEMITDNYAENANQKLKDLSITELCKSDKKTLKIGLQAMNNYNVCQSIKDEEALVVAGSGDQAVQRKQAKHLSELLNCKHMEINTTHLMLQEKPIKASNIIENFVKKYK